MKFDALKLAVPGVRGLEPYQPGKPIEEVEREYGIKDAVKLASNENPLGPSPAALAALRDATAALARYPDGGGTLLKDALARKLKVPPAHITLGNGSNDVLEFAARAFLTPGDCAMFSQHAFAVYPIVTQAVGGRALVVPARDWGHDLAAMRAQLTPAVKLVFLANPNNPTGTWFNRAALEEFLDTVAPTTVVVLDEAYCEYVTQGEYPDGLALLPRYPNLIVTRTFSKIYGLAGLRVGYGVSHPQIADLLNRVRQPFNVNSLAQAAAIAALEDQTHVQRSRALNAQGLKQLEEGVSRLGLSFIPSVANFLSVRVPRPGVEIFEALLRRGVIVRPIAGYGMPQFIRVTTGTVQENTRFLEALAAVLQDR